MVRIAQESLDIIFNSARTYSKLQEKEVSDEILQAAYDFAKMGPTSSNCLPMRIVFIKSNEAKLRLKPHLTEGNMEKTMSAPVTAIIAQDLKFYEHLPTLFPHTNAKSWFEGNQALIEETAFRNSSLQGAYFIIAARSLGLDIGPMSGFNKESLDKEFFPEGNIKSNFLCNIGYGDKLSLHPRNYRLSFDEACKIL
jgi:3-hydroxypropanoate dehydrogenase